MHRRFVTLRIIAALTFAVVSAPLAASAQDDGAVPEGTYATLLRTINPHLQVNQSLRYARSIIADAERSNLDPRLIVALVTVESSWRPNAVSSVGARGLGQLMPTTAAQLGVHNAWDPAQNLRGAAEYLRAMLNRFAGRGTDTLRYAIGAYNAGPKAVEKFGGIPPYQETQNYVRRVLAVWKTLSGRVGPAFNDGDENSAAVTTGSDGRLWLAHENASALPLDARSDVTPATDSGTAMTATTAADTTPTR
jgi:soluble lytic murein transglycosylase-like protein